MPPRAESLSLIAGDPKFCSCVLLSYALHSHPGRGQRLFPDGTLNSAHWVETPDYVQITGTGNFDKINIAAGDAGGELDPHGAGKFLLTLRRE